MQLLVPPAAVRPGAHGSQETAPTLLLKVPAAHRRHGVDPSAS
jgi:hypothetical protein